MMFPKYFRVRTRTNKRGLFVSIPDFPRTFPFQGGDQYGYPPEPHTTNVSILEMSVHNLPLHRKLDERSVANKDTHVIYLLS